MIQLMHTVSVQLETALSHFGSPKIQVLSFGSTCHHSCPRVSWSSQEAPTSQVQTSDEISSHIGKDKSMLSSTSVTAWVLAWTSLCKQKCESLAQLLLLHFFMVLCAESYWRRTRRARLKPSRWNARTKSSLSVCSTTLQAPVYANTVHTKQSLQL